MLDDGVGEDLRPGDLCPRSGLYQVVHREHRTPHKVVISAGDVFPECRHCGDAVRFRFVLESAASPMTARARAAHRRSTC